MCDCSTKGRLTHTEYQLGRNPTFYLSSNVSTTGHVLSEVTRRVAYSLSTRGKNGTARSQARTPSPTKTTAGNEFPWAGLAIARNDSLCDQIILCCCARLCPVNAIFGLIFATACHAPPKWMFLPPSRSSLGWIIIADSAIGHTEPRIAASAGQYHE